VYKNLPIIVSNLKAIFCDFITGVDKVVPSRRNDVIIIIITVFWFAIVTALIFKTVCVQLCSLITVNCHKLSLSTFHIAISKTTRFLTPYYITKAKR